MAACALWIVVGLFLLARRYSGAFSQSLSDPALAGCGVVMVAAAALIRKLWLAGCAGKLKVFEWLMPSLAIVMTAFAISVPGASSAGLVVFWMLLLIGESVWLLGLLSSRRTSTLIVSDSSTLGAQLGGQLAESGKTKVEPGQVEISQSSDVDASSGLELEEPEPNEAQDPNVIQQLIRSCDDEGNESMAGKVRLNIAAAQQAGRVHIAFSPPFSKSPEVYIEPGICDVEFQVKLSQAFAHGARIDVRLNEVAELDTTVWLEVYAVA